MTSLLQNSFKHAGKAECHQPQLILNTRFYSMSPQADSTKSADKKTSVRPQKQLKQDKVVGHEEDDYLGPVCSRSNLRQIWHTTRFSGQSFVNLEAEKKNVKHPYSLQEFWSDPIQPPKPLSELKAQLELQDLEWCFFRKRVDKFNQMFWESQSTRFEEYETQVKLTVSENKDLNLTPEENVIQQERLDCALDEFYKTWLIQEKEAFKKYNWDWWRLQPALMKGGWKAQMRHLRWKLACWKYTLW